MNTPPDLLKAIRTGRLSDVVAALDAGAPLELDDGKGEPGLPLAIACFMGHAEIVRELAFRGAKLNSDDYSLPSPPLAMLARAGRHDVVKVLIGHGAIVADGTATGLRIDELMLARWKAQQFGATHAGFPIDGETVIEEINVGRCYGTDTGILDAEMRRAVEEITRKK